MRYPEGAAHNSRGSEDGPSMTSQALVDRQYDGEKI